jgi:hypothetical protein
VTTVLNVLFVFSLLNIPRIASNHGQDRLYDFGYSTAAAVEASNPPSKACSILIRTCNNTYQVWFRKIVIGLLLSSGLFVIAAAIIRATLTLSAHPSALAVNEWGVRETLVGIITVNIPILRPMFKRSFWSWQNNTNISSSFRTTTGAGKSTDITGPYELTPSIAEGSKPSDRGSQESIFKKDSVTMAAVVVKTTYDVTHETAIDGDESWYGERRGQTKASAQVDSRV